jgi:phenylacetate-CoA ligase
MLSLAEQPCREGRGLHVIDQVSGRSTDFVMKCDGTLMHALSVIYIMRAVEGVGEFKIIQHEIDRIEVQIVTNALWRDSAKSEIVQAFRSRMGPSTRVEIVVLDAIPPEASGKHRQVVSRLALPLDGVKV